MRPVWGKAAGEAGKRGAACALAVAFLMSWALVLTWAPGAGRSGWEEARGHAGKGPSATSGWLAAAAPLPASTTGPAATVFIGQVQGEVWVCRRGGKWSAARPGMALGPHDQIRTGKNGSADLLFPGGSAVRMGAGALLSLDRLPARWPAAWASQGTRPAGVEESGSRAAGERTGVEQVRMRLDVGRIWVFIRRGWERWLYYEVETPTVVAGVRGTVFSVAVEPEPGWVAPGGVSVVVSVWEGRVEVASRAEPGWKVYVGAGQELRWPGRAAEHGANAEQGANAPGTERKPEQKGGQQSGTKASKAAATAVVQAWSEEEKDLWEALRPWIEQREAEAGAAGEGSSAPGEAGAGGTELAPGSGGGAAGNPGEGVPPPAGENSHRQENADAAHEKTAGAGEETARGKAKEKPGGQGP